MASGPSSSADVLDEIALLRSQLLQILSRVDDIVRESRGQDLAAKDALGPPKASSSAKGSVLSLPAPSALSPTPTTTSVTSQNHDSNLVLPATDARRAMSLTPSAEGITPTGTSGSSSAVNRLKRSTIIVHRQSAPTLNFQAPADILVTNAADVPMPVLPRELPRDTGSGETSISVPARPANERLPKGRLSIYSKSVMEGRFTQRGSLASINKSEGFPTLTKADETSPGPFDGFHPRSAFVERWNFASAFFYMAIVFMVPVALSFEVNAKLIPYISIITTAFYALDIAIRLLTRHAVPYSQGSDLKDITQNIVRAKRSHIMMIEEEQILSLQESQIAYLKTSLIFDLILCLPWDLVFTYEDSWLLLLIKIFYTRYLFRTFFRNPYFKILRRRTEEFFGVGQAFSGIFVLTAVLFIFLHLQACGIFFMARLTDYVGTPMGDVAQKPFFAQYSYGFFNALANTFPLAYKPTDPLEQWVIAFYVIIGAIIYSTIIGTISSFSFGLDASGRLYKQKLDEINEYMNWKHLPEGVRAKVRKFYALKYRGKFFEESALHQTLNEPLRQEVAMFNCRDLIEEVPFLNRKTGDGRDELFVGKVAKALEACFFVKGQLICAEGEFGSDMYFIVHGKVQVLVNKVPVKVLHDGNFFGEIAMVAEIPRTAFVSTRPHILLNDKFQNMHCSLGLRLMSSFEPILQEFDDVRLKIEEVHKDRLKFEAENRTDPNKRMASRRPTSYTLDSTEMDFNTQSSASNV